MLSLRSRLAKLEHAGPEGEPLVVIVKHGETEDQAFARLGIDRDKLHPARLVVVVDRTGSCSGECVG